MSTLSSADFAIFSASLFFVGVDSDWQYYLA